MVVWLPWTQNGIFPKKVFINILHGWLTKTSLSYFFKLGSIYTIELKGLRFFAGRGLYIQEELVGNEFEVDLVVEMQAAQQIVSIDQTINYVELFQLIKEEINQNTPLLETTAFNVSEKLRVKFPNIDKITLSIRKLNPPITGFMGSVGITYSTSFK